MMLKWINLVLIILLTSCYKGKEAECCVDCCNSSTNFISNSGNDFFSILGDTTIFDVGGTLIDFPRRGGTYYDTVLDICTENPCSASTKLITDIEEEFIVTRSFYSSDYILCVGVVNQKNMGDRYFWGYKSVQNNVADDYSYGNEIYLANSLTSSVNFGGYTYSDVYVLEHGLDTIFFNRTLGILKFQNGPNSWAYAVP